MTVELLSAKNLQIDQHCMLSDVEFNASKVSKALRSQKISYSYGPDGLPSILLHNLAQVINEPLSFILMLLYDMEHNHQVGILSCILDTSEDRPY